MPVPRAMILAGASARDVSCNSTFNIPSDSIGIGEPPGNMTRPRKVNFSSLFERLAAS